MTSRDSVDRNVWSKFNQALTKTRTRISEGISNLVSGDGSVTASMLSDLEACLLSADVGTRTTDKVLAELKSKASRRQLRDQTELAKALEKQLCAVASSVSKQFHVPDLRPFVVLVVGVNGVGKTTTIGKLAHRFKSDGYSVMLAAADTYRAAAIEQLQSWGRANEISVVSQKQGADSASVVHDAMQAAKARGIDILLVDTAGRLHSKTHLMDELAKVQRVMNRLDPNAPHECLLVLDATAGQNTLTQIEKFHEAVDLSGLIITKLDGTAKGGVVLALPSFTQVPLYFVGLGEGIDALRDYDPKAYVAGLLSS